MGLCYNTAVVNAPVEKVWEAIRDFHDLGWSKNVVTSVETVGDAGGGDIGARRVLNGAFHETLQTLDEEERSLTYSIDDGPGPVAKDAVSNFVGAVRLWPVTQNETTFVEWQASYESQDDDAVGDFCNPIYQGLLKDLQEHFG